jgi:hypothetical protein
MRPIGVASLFFRT